MFVVDYPADAEALTLGEIDVPTYGGTETYTLMEIVRVERRVDGGVRVSFRLPWESPASGETGGLSSDVT